MFLLGELVSLNLLGRLLIASTLWVLFQLLIRYHPRGIEIVGALLSFLGFCWWFLNPRLLPPYGAGLFLVGILVHALGRLLYRLRIH